ncbi:MAG: WD40 repeat domain-containing protein [Nitrosotalea sp.]
MKFLYFSMIVIIFVGGTGTIFAQTNNTHIQSEIASHNFTCLDRITEIMKAKYASFDEERAKTESVNYDAFKSAVKNDTYIFHAVSQEWKDDPVKCDATLKAVLVLFSVTNASGKDRDITVIINPESYKPQGIDVQYDVPIHGGGIIQNLGETVVAENSTGTGISSAPQYSLWNYLVEGQVTSVDMSQDGAFIVAGTKSGSNRGTVDFLDRNGDLLWQHVFDRDICCVAITPDGLHVLVGGYNLSGGGVGNFAAAQSYKNGQIYYLNNNGTLQWSHDFGIYPILSIAMSTDGSLIGADTDNGKILYFDEHGQLLLNHSNDNIIWNHTGLSNMEKFSQNNTYTIRGEWATAGHTVQFFDKGGNLLWYYDADTPSSVAISSKGEYVAVGTGSLQDLNHVYFFNGAPKTQLQTLQSELDKSQIQVEGAVLEQRNTEQYSQALTMLEVGIPIFGLIIAMLLITRQRKKK